MKCWKTAFNPSNESIFYVIYKVINGRTKTWVLNNDVVKAYDRFMKMLQIFILALIKTAHSAECPIIPFDKFDELKYR